MSCVTEDVTAPQHLWAGFGNRCTWPRHMVPRMSSVSENVNSPFITHSPGAQQNVFNCEHSPASAAQFCSVLSPWLRLLLEKISPIEVSTRYALGVLLKIMLCGIIMSSLGVGREGGSGWLKSTSLTQSMLSTPHLNMLISSFLCYFFALCVKLPLGRGRSSIAIVPVHCAAL